MTTNAIDIIVRSVLERVNGAANETHDRVAAEIDQALQQVLPQAERAVQEAISRATADLDQRIRDTVTQVVTGAISASIPATTPIPPVVVEPGPGVPTPVSAGRRTLFQGAVAVLITTILGFLATALGSEDFGLLDWGSWQGALSGAGIAGIAAVVAFVQRRIGR